MPALSRRSLVTGGLVTAAALAQERAGAPRIGLVGLGNRGRRHLDALSEVGGAEVAALSDIQGDRMRAAARGPASEAELYTDYRELIADRRVQAVVVAVPNYLHAEVAIAAMRAGKHVLVEKPIGITYEEARRVAETARETGMVLSVGMQRYFNNNYRAIIDAVRSGVIGAPHMFVLDEYRGDWNPRTWQWTDPDSGRSVPWRHRRSLAGSSLLEFSIHSYAFLYEMIDTPLTYCAATGGAVQWPERTTEDNIAVIAEFGDIRLQHAFSCSAPGARWNLTITGASGSLQYDFRGMAIVRAQGAAETNLLSEPTPAGQGSLEAQMYQDFFRAVRERDKPLLNAEFSIEASKIAYGAWLSIDERRIVTDRDFL
ncbi:MAG: Gfo/Idh/MocA family oxidoreductase [Bryobacterales bacterium]|nr:Gfo/Idh/MocA family oxidoreductase [Bryobacterales bacterium]